MMFSLIWGVPLWYSLSYYARKLISSKYATSIGLRRDCMNNGVGIVVALILIALYFLPAIIASSRKHPSMMAIFAVNLLFGWTFLGWIWAFIWALTDNSHRGSQVVVVVQEPRNVGYILPSGEQGKTIEAAPHQLPASPQKQISDWKIALLVIIVISVIGTAIVVITHQSAPKTYQPTPTQAQITPSIDAPKPSPAVQDTVAPPTPQIDEFDGDNTYSVSFLIDDSPRIKEGAKVVSVQGNLIRTSPRAIALVDDKNANETLLCTMTPESSSALMQLYRVGDTVRIQGTYAMGSNAPIMRDCSLWSTPVHKVIRSVSDRSLEDYIVPSGPMVPSSPAANTEPALDSLHEHPAPQ